MASYHHHTWYYSLFVILAIRVGLKWSLVFSQYWMMVRIFHVLLCHVNEYPLFTKGLVKSFPLSKSVFLCSYYISLSRNYTLDICLLLLICFIGNNVNGLLFGLIILSSFQTIKVLILLIILDYPTYQFLKSFWFMLFVSYLGNLCLTQNNECSPIFF